MSTKFNLYNWLYNANSYGAFDLYGDAYKIIKKSNTIINNIDNWLSSKKIKSELKISSCKLMHLRESGKLEFKKVGNAYFYKLPTQCNE